jgi:hypothetical protein
MESIGFITIPPTRGITVKFTRRPDLTPQTRIHIVMLAWLHQGTYGHMTQIAKAYRISRTFLYQLLLTATLQLEALFSDDHQRLPHQPYPCDQLALLLRLEGKCSIPSLSAIFKYLGCHPYSVGSLSTYFQRCGQTLPSTLSMPSMTVVFYLSDELFATHKPILVTIDAKSTAIVGIELASDRCAETWKAHFHTLHDHGFHSIGMASDRGVGLVAGYQAACPDAQWVSDSFHEFRDLFDLLHQLERKAYAAIGKEDEAVKKFAQAKSEANLQKRLHQYEQARQVCDQAIKDYDQLDLLLHLLREALQICSPLGRLRTVEGVRSELTLLLNLIEELDSDKIPKVLNPIKAHIDDILVPFQQAETIYVELLQVLPQQALEALILAWYHDHLIYQSQTKQKRYHQYERATWLAFAEGLLEHDFESLKTLVFDHLDAIIRASSLVEMVNSFIRPYLNSCKGQITQEALNLIMFYHNHRRYKSGKRKGKAPIELLTGETLEADWVELLNQQIHLEPEARLDLDEPSTAPAQLRSVLKGETVLPTAVERHIPLDADASEPRRQQPVTKAA